MGIIENIRDEVTPAVRFNIGLGSHWITEMLLREHASIQVGPGLDVVSDLIRNRDEIQDSERSDLPQVISRLVRDRTMAWDSGDMPLGGTHPRHPRVVILHSVLDLTDDEMLRATVPAYLWIRAGLQVEWSGDALVDQVKIGDDPITPGDTPRHPVNAHALPTRFRGSMREALNGLPGGEGMRIAHKLMRLGNLHALADSIRSVDPTFLGEHGWCTTSSGVLLTESGVPLLGPTPPATLVSEWSVLDPYRAGAPSSRSIAMTLINECMDMGRNGQAAFLVSLLTGMQMIGSSDGVRVLVADRDDEDGSHLVPLDWEGRV